MKKNIIANNKIVYDDGLYLYYPEEINILRDPFARLMAVSEKEASERFYTFKDLSFEFSYDEVTSIKDYMMCVIEKMGFKTNLRQFQKNACDGADPLRFLVCDQLISLDSHDRKFEEFLGRCGIINQINSIMLFWAGAGDVWNDDGLRYYMHSKERGKHKSPHIHVEYRHEEEVSIEILTGKKLAGEMKEKRFKKAKQRILDNQKFLLQFWNDKTDGINVDINHFLGITPIVEDPYEKYRQ